MKDKKNFLPLLLLYILVVLIFSSNTFYGDERRYVWYATNLTQGYYSPQNELNLHNGPGYPIILVPFILLKLPWLSVKLLNPLFLFVAILYFYYTLRLYMQERTAFIFSYLIGLYPPFLRFMPYMLTEVFAIFLVCGFIFHFCKLHYDYKNSGIHLLITSVYLGYLALTKIFFGYAILTGLLLFLSLFLWKKENTLKKTLLVYIFALICCLPYLFYTYSLTGKMFYWGNKGGYGLYWMSTPYEGELGDWHGEEEMRTIPQLSKNHQKYFDELAKLSSIRRNEEFIKQAIRNMINNPKKYFKNWMANIGRLLFNYPYSYLPQRLSTYFYIIPNMFLVVFCILCLYPTYLGRKLIPYEVYALVLFGLISFGGSSLITAYNRQFQPLVPILTLWLFFTLSNIVKMEIRQ